jgi:hypothetical protein
VHKRKLKSAQNALKLLFGGYKGLKSSEKGIYVHKRALNGA